jgi:hypothetical protein
MTAQYLEPTVHARCRTKESSTRPRIVRITCSRQGCGTKLRPSIQNQINLVFCYSSDGMDGTSQGHREYPVHTMFQILGFITRGEALIYFS